MPNKNLLYVCRVCGLNQKTEPWGKDGKIPSFDICTCCGVQFGYEDCTLEAIHLFRAEWIKTGAHWAWPKNKPIDWNLEEQLRNIPDEYK